MYTGIFYYLSLGIPGKHSLLKLSIKDLDYVLKKWDKNLKIFSNEIALFDGIKQVIQELKSKNITLGIITSKTRILTHLIIKIIKCIFEYVLALWRKYIMR